MLLTDKVWNKIRHQFSEDDKVELRKATTGEVICPRGVTIDTEKLNTHLKIRFHHAYLEEKDAL